MPLRVATHYNRRMNATVQQAAEQILADSAPNYPILFRGRVAEDPAGIGFTIPDGDGWRDVSWGEVQTRVDQAAAGLISLGLRPEQRVAIAGNTRIEWVLADLAIACAAGATTTVYPNTHAEDLLHIVSDSNSVMIFAENNEQLAKVVELTELADQVRHIILFDDDRPVDAEVDDRVLTWDELLRRGSQYLSEHPSCVDDAIATLGPESLSTIIYTSGTTGRPKGVELLHRNWTYEAQALRVLDFVYATDVLYLWLPLSHVFGRALLAVQLSLGFRSVVDGRVDRIVDGLATTHPTVLVGVPRIFEKVRAAVLTMNPQGGLKGRISRWAFKVGRDSRPYRLAGRPLPRRLAMQYRSADRLVFSKLKERLGGRMRLMISGSAKLSHQVQEWFYSAGIILVEGYGATETSAISFVNLPDQPRFAGSAIPGLGPGSPRKAKYCSRAHHRPRLPQPARRDWRGVRGRLVHTGDIGNLDTDGYLTITDRKKDLFKTSSGKFVAPQKVENTVMANIHVSQVVAIGDDRKYVTALVALDPVQLQRWADRRDKADLNYAELSQLPEIKQSIDRFMRRVNDRLERWEQIKALHHPRLRADPGRGHPDPEPEGSSVRGLLRLRRRDRGDVRRRVSVRPGAQVTTFSTAVQLRWTDLDAQGHVNNVMVADYLQQAARSSCTPDRGAACWPRVAWWSVTRSPTGRPFTTPMNRCWSSWRSASWAGPGSSSPTGCCRTPSCASRPAPCCARSTSTGNGPAGSSGSNGSSCQSTGTLSPRWMTLRRPRWPAAAVRTSCSPGGPTPTGTATSTTSASSTSCSPGGST